MRNLKAVKHRNKNALAGADREVAVSEDDAFCRWRLLTALTTLQGMVA
jgi:hypothetical protein